MTCLTTVTGLGSGVVGGRSLLCWHEYGFTVSPQKQMLWAAFVVLFGRCQRLGPECATDVFAGERYLCRAKQDNLARAIFFGLSLGASIQRCTDPTRMSFPLITVSEVGSKTVMCVRTTS